MRVVPFIAESAAGALAQIHQELGPDAVVLSVKPASAPGFARLWQRNRKIEVLACVEEHARHMGIGPVLTQTSKSAVSEPSTEAVFKVASKALVWNSVARLESLGLLKNASRFLQDRLFERFGPAPLVSPEQEWSAVRDLLIEFWRTPPSLVRRNGRAHVFIGPPGVGKTTVLCKWLVQTMLAQTGSARLWRLDGATANTAEFLNMYGEMFGLSVERAWETPRISDDLLLVDMPGVDAIDAEGLDGLGGRLDALGSPRLHLVLNAAYETPILLEQIKAFARFNPEDVSFTHLDEERRTGKLWNFVFGTNCSLRFLSSGQKIPGGLSQALPELLLPS